MSYFNEIFNKSNQIYHLSTIKRHKCSDICIYYKNKLTEHIYREQIFQFYSFGFWLLLLFDNIFIFILSLALALAPTLYLSISFSLLMHNCWNYALFAYIFLISIDFIRYIRLCFNFSQMKQQQNRSISNQFLLWKIDFLRFFIYANKKISLISKMATVTCETPQNAIGIGTIWTTPKQKTNKQKSQITRTTRLQKQNAKQKVFGNIALSPETAITRHNNFRSFVQGLMLLFR